MASGHVSRIKRPNTWLRRPILQNVKKLLPNRSRPHMARNGPVGLVRRCPFSVAERTLREWRSTSEFDPTRTSSEIILLGLACAFREIRRELASQRRSSTAIARCTFAGRSMRIGSPEQRR